VVQTVRERGCGLSIDRYYRHVLQVSGTGPHDAPPDSCRSLRPALAHVRTETDPGCRRDDDTRPRDRVITAHVKPGARRRWRAPLWRGSREVGRSVDLGGIEGATWQRRDRGRNMWRAREGTGQRPADQQCSVQYPPERSVQFTDDTYVTKRCLQSGH